MSDGPRPTDPVECVIYDALEQARIPFRCGHRTNSGLDFEIEDGPAIECKRLPTPRVLEQMQRCPDVIVVQGIRAAFWLADIIARKET